MSSIHSSGRWLRQQLAWSNSRQSWEERIGLLLMVAGAGCLVWLSGVLSTSQQVLLWGLLLAALAVLLRRGWLKLFGPVLFYDLLRIARRRRYYLLRTLYVGLLLFLLCWMYMLWWLNSHSGSLHANEMAGFADSFFSMFMSVQFILVAMLTPAYTAGAIAEEKDRKTLEFLLATDLRNREIVLSKLAARLLNLLLILLAGMPILSILQVVGGVDPNLVLAGFAATGLTMASLGGLSILNSVLTKRPRDAIAATYLGAAGYLILSGLSWLLLLPNLGVANFPSTAAWTSPLTVTDLVEMCNAGNIVAVLVQLTSGVARGGRLGQALPIMLRDYAIFHGLVASVCCTWAVLRVRAIALAQSYGKQQKLALGTRFWGRPRVRNWPMVWKEVYAEPGFRFNWLGRIMLGLLVLASFLPVGFILGHFLEQVLGTPGSGTRYYGDPWANLGEAMNVWMRMVGTMIACLMLLGVAVRASSTVSGERDKQTLDALLTSPLSSNAILFGKWLGSILSVRWAWLWLGLVWGLALATGGLHVLSLPPLLIGWVVFAAALAGLGLWFSVVAQTTLRATIWTLLCTAGLGVGHWLVWMCCIPLFRFSGPRGPDKVFEWIAKFQVGLTPPLTLGWLLPFRSDDYLPTYRRKEDWELPCALLGIFVWAIGALLLWSATSQRFQDLFRRHSHPPGRRFRDDPTAAVTGKRDESVAP